MTAKKANDTDLEPLVVRQAAYICDAARMNRLRTGQMLFNTLRADVADKVRATRFDPFYKDLTFEEVMQWYKDHIIFNDRGDMIAVRGGGELLWRETNG